MKKSAKANQRRPSGPSDLGHPPQINPSIRLVKVFRFQTNATAAVNITAALLLDLLAVGNTAGTNAYRLFRSIRVHKVECWGIGAIGAASEYISVTGAGVGPENRRTDTSMGVTPAHVAWRPAPGSQSSFWRQTGTSETDVMFVLNLPGSCVVHLTLEFIMQCADGAATAVSAANTPAAATVGTLFCANLDGKTSGKIPPQDYTVLA